MKRLLIALLSVAGVVGVAAPAMNAHAATRTCAKPHTLTGVSSGMSFSHGTRVNMDQWTGQGKQTMSVCSPSDWVATVTEKGAPATGVKTYPNSERTFTDWVHCASQPRIGSFKKMTGTFAARSAKAGAWDMAYDVFLNGGVCGKPTTEVMVWNQWHNIDVPAAQARTTIGGVAYDVYHSGGYIQLRRRVQVASGSVDLHAVFQYLAGQHLISTKDTLQFVQFGAEVLTTNGKPQQFAVTRFSVAT